MELTGIQQSLWRALFHPTRRQIIRLLKEKSRTTGELSNFFDVTRFAVMKHLRVLEQADLIHIRREGRLRWNVLNEERLQDLPEDYLEQWQASKNSSDEIDETAEFGGEVSSLDYEVALPVAPERVYRAFLDEINDWWPDRKMKGSRMVLEPFVGGRFSEVNDDIGAGVLFGFVSCLEPSKEIRIFGPMDTVEAASLSMIRIRLEGTNGRTQLRLSHRLVGEVNDSSIAAHAMDWEERLDDHLRAFVTTGSPTVPGKMTDERDGDRDREYGITR